MTRDEALASYHPIRASVRQLLKEAVGVCNQSDLKRAAKALGLWANEKIVVPEDEGPVEMLSDIALFEPNQRGRRAFDVFLTEHASKLDANDAEMARRMGRAFFSLFRYAGPHESGGIWLENLLDGDKRLWLMDERMEETAPKAGAFGMRIFDAGPFYVGFGIAAPTDDETAEFAIQGVRRNGRAPFRDSLAVTLYSDCINGRTGFDPEIEEAFLESLATALISKGSSQPPLIRVPPSRRGRARKTK